MNSYLLLLHILTIAASMMLSRYLISGPGQHHNLIMSSFSLILLLMYCCSRYLLLKAYQKGKEEAKQTIRR